jgi:hypothetical protein
MIAVRRTAVAWVAMFIVLAGVSTTPTHALPRLGFEVGPELSSLRFSDDPLELEPTWKVGYHGTVLARSPLGSRLELVTGIGYRHLLCGERMTLEPWFSDGIPPDPELLMRGTSTFDWDFDQLVLPARIEWRPWPRSGARLEVGGEAAYLMRARERMSRVELVDFAAGASARQRPASATATIFERYDLWRDVTDRHERLWGSVAGGVGWDFPWGEHSLGLDLRYVQGVHDVLRSSELAGSARSLELSLGYRH